MDIRNFFAPKATSGGGSKPTTSATSASTAKKPSRPKPALSDSSEEEEEAPVKPGKKTQSRETAAKKKRHVISDSDDDDDFIPSSVDKSKRAAAKSKKPSGNGHVKSPNGHSSNTKSPNGKTSNKSESTKLKPVAAKDFFAASSAKLPKIPKLEKKEAAPHPVVSEPSPSSSSRSTTSSPSKDKKRKSPDDEIFDDEDFESMVQDIDFDAVAQPSPVKKSKISETELSSKTLAQKLSSKVKEETNSSNEKKSKQSKSEKSEKETKREKKRIVEDVVKETSKSTSPRKARATKSPPKGKATTPVKVKTEKSPVKAKAVTPVKTKAAAPAKPKALTPSKAQRALPEKPKVTSTTLNDLRPSLKISPKKMTSSQGSSSSQDTSDSCDLWVDKYKPTNSKAIIGQQGDKSNMRKLTTWLEQWAKNNAVVAGKKPLAKPPPWNTGADNGFWAKSALLSGPPGVGKTTTAYLVAKELGYDVMELNASDTRSKKSMSSVVADALTSQSLSNVSTKRILLMDEVDGMAGNEDRGGVAELIQLIKSSRIPVVCMCNDRNHPKIRSLANHCFDLRFQRPRVEQIRAAMMSICFKEKIKISPDALNELISGCNQDIRQVLHHLSMVKAKDLSDSVDGKYSQKDAKEEAERAKKTSIKVGPWDVCRKVFSNSDQQSMSLSDKSDLFFHDYSIGPLFVQENYLSVMPIAAKNDPKKAILLASKAADSLCSGDLVERLIRSQNSWSLLPVQAMYSSVLPGEYMSGYVQGQIQFPNWLGKNSKQGKIDRMLQELQMHTRLSAGLSKRALNLDFVQPLRDSILRPMVRFAADGVEESVKVMSHYSLLREDLDNLLEVTQWPDKPDPMKAIESKVKAAFTRTYNKEVVLPYASQMAAVSKRSAGLASSAEDLMMGEEEEEDDDDDGEDESIEKDAMIKVKKQTSAKASSASSEAGSSASRGRGRGGGAGSRGGRGRGKK